MLKGSSSDSEYKDQPMFNKLVGKEAYDNYLSLFVTLNNIHF